MSHYTSTDENWGMRCRLRPCVCKLLTAVLGQAGLHTWQLNWILHLSWSRTTEVLLKNAKEFEYVSVLTVAFPWFEYTIMDVVIAYFQCVQVFITVL